MASKGPRSKLDHESRAKRHKGLEAPKEPRRPKTHWDHVLEEMAWLSKDFESERKWKLAQAKKVSIRASKGTVDLTSRGERRIKEEELRLRKVALNISKDVKKFWTKIEKLVLYKHQLELDKKKKKTLDKQLEFLLGQTERYSSMLAENLVTSPAPCKASTSGIAQNQPSIQWKEGDEISQTSESDTRSQSDSLAVVDEDYDLLSEDEPEDDEHTIEEDEALITNEEREEELAALQDEIDLPLEEILKRYAAQEVSKDNVPDKVDSACRATELRDSNGKEKDAIECVAETDRGNSCVKPGRRSVESNGVLSVSENHCPVIVKTYKKRTSVKKFLESEKKQMLNEFNDEQEDDDFVLSAGEENAYGMDDETTLLEEEELANAEPNNMEDEIALLQKESEISVEELLARYKKVCDDENGGVDFESSHSSGSDELPGSSELRNSELKQPDDTINGFHPNMCEEDEAEFPGKSEDVQSEDIIADAAAAARSAQPTGNTFLTTKVRTKFPFLLKYPLREYQHIGLDWLVTMYEKRLNGILADEMGLGKTIMTIALLAHLACEKGIWGPHLIVVPTSVMLNWETEFLKWCPAFKILTYFGSAKERKIKRQGWLKPNSFHVCITTYRLVIQDSKVFKRKKWKYLILDEAHLIKNWKSQRWQTLLNFNSKRRILLTGTPLQNDLMELWSLMHFLMPHVFQSHQEFKEWFSNPISGMADGQEKVNKEVVDRLHNVLRPFILRRLKRDVEKQLPSKHEHVIYCRLSRRQRNLYEDFIASSETQATLASTNFFGMISVIMQLRKVCNHPDLFEGRPIVSSFDMSCMDVQLSSSVCSILSPGPFSTVDLSGLGFVFTHLDFSMTSWESDEIQAIATPSSFIENRVNLVDLGENRRGVKHKKKMHGINIFEEIQKALLVERLKETKERASTLAWWNSLRCKKKPMYATDLRELVSVKHPVLDIHLQKHSPFSYKHSSKLAEIVLSPVERFGKIVDQVESFMFAIPAARAPAPVCWCSKSGSPVFFDQTYKERCSQALFPLLTPFRPAIVRRQVYFPDRRLIQFDCGKLQELAVLLRRLKSEGHRALIFTQMTKMLDVLEAFISLYGYTYMRLDGSTPPEERQTLMQRFNTNRKIFLFILSTRSGGVGVNLVGADTVIFYDSDWNPAMDQQAQDRCHRIGQTREVNIYRLISESTIEENILKKANQKRALDDLVIQSGSYNTDFFKKLDPMELISGNSTAALKDMQTDKTPKISEDITLSNADLDAALKNAEDEADYMALKKVEEEEAVDNQEFTEEAVGKLEDDDFLNEEDMKPDGPAENRVIIAKPDITNVVNGNHLVEEGPLLISAKEDDIDMLADVKQMAAAAAAVGQEILSFENQLRPIDRYAVRFLELWDPIIDKAAVESHIHVEEREWELDHIEKLKDDMEAEIDDEEEPLVYESWDTDFATEVYKQQVETLAQHQLMEDLEREAQEKAALEAESLRNDIYVTPKKKKKKTKKAKFKSLKKGALGSISMKEESSLEHISIDDYDEMLTSSDDFSPCSTKEKKRKPASDDDEPKSRRKSKKLKASELGDIIMYPKSFSKHQIEHKDLRVCDSGVAEPDPKLTIRIKNRGKLSIPVMPLKRVFTIKPEKLKKKVNIWSKDCFSPPDHWSSHEDILLCAVVYEYGPNWNLASEILYGMTAGGSYRGRYRHPVHCCERVRELIQRYMLSVSDATNKDKSVNIGSGKALLRVTEDNMRALLDITTERQDNETLLQNHFFAVLSATWRNLSRSIHRNGTLSSQTGFDSSLQLFGSTKNHQSSLTKSSEKLEFTNLHLCEKLVAAALNVDCSPQSNDRRPIFDQREELPLVREQLDVTLEVPGERGEDSSLSSVINVSILGPDLPPSVKTYSGEDCHFRPLRVEKQFSTMSGPHVESSDFQSQLSPRGDTRARSQGKNKFPLSDSAKPSKSKPKKISKDRSDLHSPAVHEVFPSLPVIATDISLRSDELSCCIPEAGNLEFDLNWFLDIDQEQQASVDSLEMFPLDGEPDLPSGLDDWSILPEFTDIG